MSQDTRHPSGHDGVYDLHDAAGRVTGYVVDDCKTVFGTLAKALAWRDGPDNERGPDLPAPDLPDPDRPRRGRSR